LPRVARVRHQVHFRETGCAGIPTIDPQGDVMLRPATRPCAAVEASLGGGFVGAQPAVDLAGADGQQLALYLGAEVKMLSHPGHPQRDQGLQPHRPGITRRPPDGLQHRYQLLAVGGPPWRWVIGLRPRPTGRRPVQQPQGILAVAFRVGAKLVPNLPLHFARCLAVTSVNGSQVFPYALPSHPNPPSKALCWVTLSDGLTARVTFLNGLTAPHLVTFETSRFAALSGDLNGATLTTISQANAGGRFSFPARLGTGVPIVSEFDPSPRLVRFGVFEVDLRT